MLSIKQNRCTESKDSNPCPTFVVVPVTENGRPLELKPFLPCYLCNVGLVKKGHPVDLLINRYYYLTISQGVTSFSCRTVYV